MGKLKSLGSALATLKPLVASHRDEHGHSRVAEPWRKWYSTTRWAALKARVHLRDLFTCQEKTCGKLIQLKSHRIADHIRPHRGDPALFWDETNVQTLCKTCHDSLKQREEARFRARGG